MRRFHIKYSFGSDLDKLSESDKANKRGELALLMLSHLKAVFYLIGLTQFELGQFRASQEGKGFDFDEFELILESIGELGDGIAESCYSNVNEALTYYQKLEGEGK